MKRIAAISVLVLTISISLAALTMESAEAFPNDNACWGEATAIFAQTYDMGEHASEQPTPRLGLRNLARALADQGVIPDDSLQSLGTFVAAELGLSIDSCQ